MVSWRGGTDLVEDHPGDRHVWLQGGVAVHHGGHGGRHGRRVHHQQDRRLEQAGHVGCRRRGSVAGAVEQAHDAFDEEQVAARSGPGRRAGATASTPQSQASRLRGGRPEARAWYPGSMKSGPTLAAAGRWPAWRRAAISPVATVVLPTPEWVPPITSRGPRAGLDMPPGCQAHRRPATRLPWSGDGAGLRHPDPVGGAPGARIDNCRPDGEGLLLVAHGSECVRSGEEIGILAARVAGRPALAWRSKSGFWR